MAYDIINPIGAPKSSKPDAGGANIRSVPVLGIVKNNIDPIRAGRLQVYIADFGSNDPSDPSGWATVSFMSPFFGSVQPSGGSTTYGSYVANPSSYGMWNSPPDIGTTVVCIFINGDPSYGYYIGCVPKPEALHMVPAIGSSENIVANNGSEAAGYGGATRLPVTNINTNNDAIAGKAGFLNEAKPVHSYSAMVMNQQGLIRDPLRGPISSSAQRESPSRVGWGVSTPGRPIYEGGYTDETIVDAIKEDKSSASLKVIARRGGHSIVMDDGDVVGQDQLVRIRSAKGHQILMSDDGQTLFIIHSNGQSYIELGKEGTIDMYSTNSVNIRTQGDLNFHADNNINLNAAKKLNIHAESIVMQSDQDTAIKVGANQKIETSGTFTHKVAGPMSMQSAGDASYASSGMAFINGSKVNLNTGSSSTVPSAVPSIPLQAHTDTLYDKIKGYAAAPGKLLSITSRAPAHAPWANAGQGVDVKTTNSASASLPAAPATKVSATNNSAAASAVTVPVSPAAVSTVPAVNAVSSSIDKRTSSAMVATIAQSAVNNPALAPAIRAGVGVVTTASGRTGSIGVLAQTPKLLETAGLLKPGSSRLINSLIQSGKTISAAIPSTLFTGQMGAKDLTAVATNVTTQVQAQVSNLQRAQSALTQLGVISGKESQGAIAGLVLSGANVGLNKTMAVIKNVGRVEAGITAITSEAEKAINSGNYAAALSQTSLSGLTSIVSAISTLDQIGMGSASTRNMGPSGAAFLSIINQFRSLAVGVPQNLRTLSQETRAALAVANVAASAAGLPANVAAPIVGIANSVGTLANASANSVLTVNAGVSLVNNITKVVNNMTAASYASGVINLPGGQTVISSIDLNKPNMKLPGTQAISNIISNVSAAVNNGISVGETGLANASATVNSSLQKLSTGITSLTALAKSTLSGSDVATLTATVAASSSTSASPVSIPAVGLNTNDRTAQTAQDKLLLGDDRIPPPNFAEGPSDSATSGLMDLSNTSANLVAISNNITSLTATADSLLEAYYEVQNTLPAGSPEIETAKLAWQAAVDALDTENRLLT